MEIKGNIGETIYVKAKLSMIQVNDSGVVYFAQVDDNGDFIPFAENDVRFEDPGKAEDVPAELPWVEPAPAKRRGRPRKATVDDLMKKAKASDNS